MEFIGPVVIAPAVGFFVLAIAFGSHNPIRWAAWGAILGPVAVIVLLWASTHQTQPVAYQAPDTASRTCAGSSQRQVDEQIHVPHSYTGHDSGPGAY